MWTDKIKHYHFTPVVLGKQISRILTEAILEGALKGGDKLVEVELQKQFEISRSPLREAFRDLEKKGLVVITPRKGTFVRRITRKDIEENFPVRATLESLAARSSYKLMDTESLTCLEQTLKKMGQAVRKRDTKAYWKHHISFHEIFINGSQNEVLINILKTLRMHSLWYRFSYQYYCEDLNKSLDDHKKIFQMFKERQTDLQELGAWVQNHIEGAAERFLAYLETQES